MQWRKLLGFSKQHTVRLGSASSIMPYQQTEHCPDCFNAKDPAAVCLHCGFIPDNKPVPPHLLPLFTSLADGRYYLGRVLGQPGGFGVVYAGVQTSLSRPVAIKEFFPFGNHLAKRKLFSMNVIPEIDNTSLFEYSRQQFLSEGRLLSRLRHPRIVAVYDFLEENDTYYLIMERLRGFTLADYLGEQQTGTGTKSFQRYLSPENAMLLLQAALEALDVLHSEKPNPIMHLDLNPGNLFLRDGHTANLTIIDFGLARRSGDNYSNIPNIMVGNLAFMAPEQVDGKKQLTPATDCYSLGTCLYAALTGNLPTAASARLTGTPLTDIETWLPSLDPILAKTIMRCLSMEPRNRPQNAKEVLQQLAGVKINLYIKSLPLDYDAIMLDANATILNSEDPVIKKKHFVSPPTEPLMDIPKPKQIKNTWPKVFYYTSLILILPLILGSLLLLIWWQIMMLGVLSKIVPVVYLPLFTNVNITPAPVVIHPLSYQGEGPKGRGKFLEPVVPISEPVPTLPKAVIAVPKIVNPVPQSDYILHKEGVVTDTRTGLMWKRCTEGQIWDGVSCTGDVFPLTWYEAMPNKQQTTWDDFAGYSDWRLPTREELLTLVYCSNGISPNKARTASCSGKGWGVDNNSHTTPTISTAIFVKTPVGKFWSSSVYNNGDDAAWGIDFRYGGEGWDYYTAAMYVRLVRVIAPHSLNKR